jgi:hypothetical protein
MRCSARISSQFLTSHRHIARSAAAAKRQLSPDRPGEIPDLALPRFLTGELYF